MREAAEQAVAVVRDVVRGLEGAPAHHRRMDGAEAARRLLADLLASPGMRANGVHVGFKPGAGLEVEMRQAVHPALKVRYYQGHAVRWLWAPGYAPDSLPVGRAEVRR